MKTDSQRIVQSSGQNDKGETNAERKENKASLNETLELSCHQYQTINAQDDQLKQKLVNTAVQA